jgi:hypothetical protein
MRTLSGGVTSARPSSVVWVSAAAEIGDQTAPQAFQPRLLLQVRPGVRADNAAEVHTMRGPNVGTDTALGWPVCPGLVQCGFLLQPFATIFLLGA